MPRRTTGPSDTAATYSLKPQRDKLIKRQQRARAERLVDMTRREREIEKAEHEIDPIYQQEKLLVEAYMSTKSRSAAARLADYPDSMAVDILFNRPSVRELLARRRSQLQVELDLSPERIVREMAVLGFSNIADYTRLDEETGDRVVDLSFTPDEKLAAIQEMTTHVYMDGEREVKRTHIKMHDKRAALMELGRKFGVFDKDRETGDYNFTLNLGPVGDSGEAQEMRVSIGPRSEPPPEAPIIEGEVVPPSDGE